MEFEIKSSLQCAERTAGGKNYQKILHFW